MNTDVWYCAGWSDELNPGPIGRRLGGRQLVLFRDGNGTPRALGARCPHRGADLSQGWIVDGCVQCPFHGWCFDRAGHCVAVPSQPKGVKIPSPARVPAFPLHERDGVVWIWMGSEAPPAEPPRVPAPKPAGEPVTRRICFAAHLVAAPVGDALENFVDTAHIPFIHRSFGAHQNPLVARRRLTLDPDGRGVRAEDDPASPWQVEARLPSGVLGLLARLFLGLRQPSAQHMAFRIETGAQLYLEYPNGTFDLFRTYLTPADPDHTWLFVESLRTRAAHALGDRVQRRVIRTLFAEGSRERTLILAADPDDRLHPVSVESDRAGLAFRQLYERWADGSAALRDHDVAIGA